MKHSVVKTTVAVQSNIDGLFYLGYKCIRTSIENVRIGIKNRSSSGPITKCYIPATKEFVEKPTEDYFYLSGAVSRSNPTFGEYVLVPFQINQSDEKEICFLPALILDTQDESRDGRNYCYVCEKKTGYFPKNKSLRIGVKRYRVILERYVNYIETFRESLLAKYFEDEPDKISEISDDLKNLHKNRSFSTQNSSEIKEEKQSDSEKSEHISKDSSSSTSSTESKTSSKNSETQVQPGDYQQKIPLEANLTETSAIQDKTSPENSKKETQNLVNDSAANEQTTSVSDQLEEIDKTITKLYSKIIDRVEKKDLILYETNGILVPYQIIKIYKTENRNTLFDIKIAKNPITIADQQFYIDPDFLPKVDRSAIIPNPKELDNTRFKDVLFDNFDFLRFSRQAQISYKIKQIENSMPKDERRNSRIRTNLLYPQENQYVIALRNHMQVFWPGRCMSRKMTIREKKFTTTIQVRFFSLKNSNKDGTKGPIETIKAGNFMVITEAFYDGLVAKLGSYDVEQNLMEK